MADLDAEMAFLNSMRVMNEASGIDEPTSIVQPNQTVSQCHEDSHHLKDDVIASPVTSHADDSNHSVQTPSPSAQSSTDTLPLNSSIAQNNAEEPEQEHDATPEYDPADSLIMSAMPSVETPTETVQAVKPRTMAGFIVDEDDEVDDDNLLHQTYANTEATVAGPSNNLLAGAINAEREASGTPRPSSASRSPANINDSTLGASVQSPPSGIGIIHISNGVVETGKSMAPTTDDHGDRSKDISEQPENVKGDALGSTRSPQAPDGTQAAKVPPRARLPHDRVGILEDRIKEDPRGDTDAWLNLLDEHRKRHKLDEARSTYERMLKVFPMAAEQWVAYANMELSNNDFFRLEQLFNKCLLTVPHIQLWSLYLDYVRRRNNLTTDPAGTARTTVSQAYDIVLQNVGLDKDSGRIWQDYIQFLRSGAGSIGGSSWQDQQKMDQLRRAYQRAICIPTSAVNAIWKEYDAFEMGLNKITVLSSFVLHDRDILMTDFQGRKFLQEKSPSYMTARSSYVELDNITRGLQRTTLPKLPPVTGFDGDEEYATQVQLWKRWIDWEKNDPLVLKDEDVSAYKTRVVFVYKQALMALRFWPALWFDASEFCFQQGLDSEGNDFLIQGMAANPESCLLAFRKADNLEQTLPADEGEEGLKRRGAAVRQPFDAVLDALYDLISKAKARENAEITRIEEASNTRLLSPSFSKEDDDDDDDENEAQAAAKEAAKQAKIKTIQDGSAVQIRILSRAISFTWIALMRAMRRIQGRGKVGGEVGGSRQIFTDARKRGRLTSDVYIASALIEYHCYKDPAATKIFERGMKLFPEDETFALEYLKHLIAINDVTNARAVFETTVSKLAQKPETRSKAKPIYAFFHEYEAHYGELSQIRKLEKRMNDLFPEDPQLSRFSRRFTAEDFDPTAVRPIISPNTQTRPKAFKSIEQSPPTQETPPATYTRATNSPKRTLPSDDNDLANSRPRKMARGESPLKGAAGRRLDQQKRSQLGQGQGIPGSWASQPPPPPLLPRDVLFLLSIIPSADTYHATRFNAEALVRILRETNLPTQQELRSRPPQAIINAGQGSTSYGGYPTPSVPYPNAQAMSYYQHGFGNARY
ncbi:MAG: hypothetical protein M1825_004904 [Sarcosagium campestre]|nr:MAG: hypothetical protein M1825_004904 [Sarcosagium campestre]